MAFRPCFTTSLAQQNKFELNNIYITKKIISCFKKIDINLANKAKFIFEDHYGSLLARITVICNAYQIKPSRRLKKNEINKT